jgi:2-iminobutanoate/2-iminopropanoate deaminase
MAEKAAIFADGVPTSLGHYSQAVKLGEDVYTSAQLPLDPTTNQLRGTNVVEQAGQCLDNIMSLLVIAGGQLSNVLKMTVYLRSIEDVGKLDPLFKERFAFVPPAMSFVQVAGLPKGALIQIDAFAHIPNVQVKGGVLF